MARAPERLVELASACGIEVGKAPLGAHTVVVNRPFVVGPHSYQHLMPCVEGTGTLVFWRYRKAFARMHLQEGIMNCCAAVGRYRVCLPQICRPCYGESLCQRTRLQQALWSRNALLG